MREGKTIIAGMIAAQLRLIPTSEWRRIGDRLTVTTRLPMSKEMAIDLARLSARSISLSVDGEAIFVGKWWLFPTGLSKVLCSHFERITSEIQE